MSISELRKRQPDLVEYAYSKLKDCIAGEFQPGYFNSPKALAAERNGLIISDAVLGHVLDASPSADTNARALELLNRVSQSLIPSEVENSCHNLHGACALMLDALHVPVVVIWGSVYATDENGSSFCLNAWDGSPLQIHRPGHAWLLMPSWRVADLALVHQSGVSAGYDYMRATLPSVITVESSESSEPDESWWQYSGSGRLPPNWYAKSTQYHEVIGWSQYKTGSTTVRYLPGAPTLPKEAELADVSIKIGGLSPREFFDRNARDLIPP